MMARMAPITELIAIIAANPTRPPSCLASIGSAAGDPQGERGTSRRSGDGSSDGDGRHRSEGPGDRGNRRRVPGDELGDEPGRSGRGGREPGLAGAESDLADSGDEHQIGGHPRAVFETVGRLTAATSPPAMTPIAR